MSFTRVELEYLGTQRLGRLATVRPDGSPQVAPVGFFYNEDLGTLDIGGHGMGQSRKFRNVLDGSPVALVVDDVASLDPWQVRGVEIRGTAEALADQPPPRPGFSREIIRIHPRRVISWGLGDAGSLRRNSRDVTG